MKYFLDTEFIESGPHKPIDLISIGIVAEDGREYYAISDEFSSLNASDWVQANVLPYLGSNKPRDLVQISIDIINFVGNDEPEFWGYYCDYDWVVFCQIFGRMIYLPRGFPMFCRDLKQLADECGNPELPAQSSTEHNALNDAKWNKLAYGFLSSLNAEPASCQ